MKMGNRIKYQTEYQLKASPDLIYTYLSTPSGLAEWFAEDVKVNGEVYEFIWGEDSEKAKLVKKRIGKFVKFEWLDREGDEYFQFDIELDELTRDVAIIVTDFEDEEEVKSAKMVWDVSIDQLRSIIGA